MTLSLLSDDPRFDEIYLSNFATINVLDVLRRIPGVGRVSNVGSRYYGMQSGLSGSFGEYGVDSKGLAKCPERAK